MTVQTYKRCSCRKTALGSDGAPIKDRCGKPRKRRLGSACPELPREGHGSWYFSVPLPRFSSGPYRYLRRGGYRSRTQAHQVGSRIERLFDVPDRDDEGGRKEAVKIVMRALKNRTALPPLGVVRDRYRNRRPLAPMPTVAEWLDYWIRSKEDRTLSTQRGYRTHSRIYLKPHLGHHPIDRIRSDQIKDLLELIDEENELIALARTTRDPELCARFRYRRTAAPRTKQLVVNALRTALNAAIAERFITVNPASRIEVPDAQNPRPLLWTGHQVHQWQATGEQPGPVMVWTPEQTGAFLDHIVGDPMEALFQLLAYRGPRRGEACGLSWSDIDLDQRTAQIRRQLLLVDGKRVWADLKTVYSQRTLALDEVTVEALRRHRAQQADWKAEAGEAWQENGLVFTTKLGAPLHPGWVLDRFRALTAQAGLPPVRVHDLRHGAATLMLAAGVDIKIIQETLGHSRSSTTRDVYTCVLPRLFHDSAKAAAALVPRR
ncbi:tyrosine-type recombinase/integrase [Nocardiopsis potens]|uniref:tyrosine-type recombinase/integrase n=1 Tax=Nocardiopsis potens TaxID=1246458 RepID=UPI0013790E40|nr:site-specific integrase [Nocardiopsis potens]